MNSNIHYDLLTEGTNKLGLTEQQAKELQENKKKGTKGT